MLKYANIIFVAGIFLLSSLWFVACGEDEETMVQPAVLSLTVSPSTLYADGISIATVRIQGRLEGGEAIPDGTLVTVSTLKEYGNFDNGDTSIEARFRNSETAVVFIAGTQPGYGFIGAQMASPPLSAGAKITLLSAHVKNEPRK